MTTEYQDFINLVRLGLGNTSEYLAGYIDWTNVKKIARKHELSAVVLDGIDKLPERQRPSQNLLLPWIGEVILGYEARYKYCEKVLSEMAAFYNAHNLKMMVLKGYACSLDWPKSNHRPCGDIDIWLFGKQREADALLASEKGINVDVSHHHHTVFYWRDYMVENHYDFINVHHHRSHVALEKVLKELGKDDSHYVEEYGERVYLPSPNLHALFLLKHMALHFSVGEITLRQFLDWGFFIQKHGAEVDWKWQLPMLEKFGLLEFFGIVNAICEEKLGFVFNLRLEVNADTTLIERVYNDILNPEFSREIPSALLPRVVFKCKRWRANAWKHRLCYSDSLWSAFWSGVYGHLMKPGSI